MRVADERDEERFRQLDETIRLYQRENKGKAEAAASRSRFFPGALGKRRSLGEMGTSCKIKMDHNKKAAVANKAQQLLCILLIREILALADSASGTYTCTCSAADACICIDLVFAVSLRDCIYRTFASAGTAANASIVNYICHDELPPFFIICIHSIINIENIQEEFSRNTGNQCIISQTRPRRPGQSWSSPE